LELGMVHDPFLALTWHMELGIVDVLLKVKTSIIHMV